VKTAAQQKMEKDATENEAKGKAYRDTFAKEKGVKTSKLACCTKSRKKVPAMRRKTATPLWLTTKVR
jgi:FKBP-type peptidyl-prolyl cis-trans isomerase FkpA